MQNQRFTSFVFTTLLLLTLFSACRRREKLTATDGAIPDDFEAFYTRFHADSAYQMAHIRFPLDGLESGADSATAAAHTFRWQAAKWVMHRPLGEQDSSHVRTFSSAIPNVIQEKIQQRQTPYYSMLRRFQKDGNEWFLIYYVDMNPF